MKHKKTFLIITILTIIFICSIIIVKKNKEVYHQSKNYEINDGNLSIMLEETPKKGDYKISNLNTGTLKYKCNSNSTYHDNQASATSACINYCATGTYYNGKCHKLG